MKYKTNMALFLLVSMQGFNVMRLLYIHHVPLNINMANIVQVLQMCQAFEQTGVNVTLAIPADSKKMSEPEMIATIEQKLNKSPTFKVRSLSNFTVAGRGRSLGTYFGVKSLLRDSGGYDVCFTRSSFIAHLTVNAGFKTIYESHGVVINPRYKIVDRIYRKCLVCDALSPSLVLFVAISNALAKLWNEMGIPAQKILSLHDGFSADDYKNTASQEESRGLLGIKIKYKIVLYAGSLYKDRGIENIFRLAKVFSDVRFYVVGGPEKNKLFYENKSVQQGLNNVTFVGTVPHHKVRDYLFAADVLLMLYTDKVPTIDICSPLKAFEYMAAGRIIVGQAFPTVKEVLSDGCNALLAEVNSYKELENKLYQALQFEYPNKVAENARRLAFEKYSWRMRAQAILKELNKDQIL